MKKRVFILTDGQVSDRDAVVNAARLHSEQVRVFTFGLGSGCDEQLVRRTAQAGRGSCSLVRDNSHDLNGLVVRALQNAMEPSMPNCLVEWSSENQNPAVQKTLDEVFRDQSILQTHIMSKAAFETMRFSFKSSLNPLTQ